MKKGNGFKMWRALHLEMVGESEIIEYAGTECLRTYGQCTSVAKLAVHIDGWFELLDNHCSEMGSCPKMLRQMFLNIIPSELKTKILEEPKLQLSDHRALAKWCKARALILQKEKLTEIARKNMSKTYGGQVKAILPSEEQESSSPPSWVADLIAAVQTRPPRKTDPRGRDTRKQGDRTKSRDRSTSRGRKFIEGWGKRCNHCGSESHMKRECKEFKDMMKKANVGKPEKDWKPPEGYKSAFGKFRDAAKAAAEKAKKVASLSSDEESDTASDDSDCDFGSEHGRPIRALTKIAAPQQFQIHSVNKFEGLDYQQESADPSGV